MRRAHLTITAAALAAASALVAPELDVAPPPPEPAAPAAVAQPPTAVIRPLPRVAPPETVRTAVCDDRAAVMVAHELSRSMFEGRELEPAELATALHRVRESLPDAVRLGAVGFAQRLWSAAGASIRPESPPWLPLGSGDEVSPPADVAEVSGTCANVALGLRAAIAQLEDRTDPTRAVWLVVDGLHDCDTDGRFAYEALAPLADRAAAAGIDVSVLVVDAWSERRGPTPLHALVRGHGVVAHTPAWELEAGYAALRGTLPRCP